jgi:hypothetical protein
MDIDLTKLETELGQLARHTDRLATAAERIAAALEKATTHPEFIEKIHASGLRELVRVEPAAAAEPAPPAPPAHPFGTETW